jgi:cyclophilin family peptidyl-prolyl cis-trans isomerase
MLQCCAQGLVFDSRPAVIPGFMNQFGCPHSKDPKSQIAGTGGPPDGTFKNLKTGATETRTNGGNIQDEHVSEDANDSGTLSMANTGEPHTGGSQIFMNVNDNNGLDWFSEGPSQHVVFGHIVKGMELAVAVSEVCKAPPRLACAVVPCPPTLSHTHSRCVLTSRALAGQDGQRLPHRAHPSGLGDHLQPVSWRLCAATALGGDHSLSLHARPPGGCV